MTGGRLPLHSFNAGLMNNQKQKQGIQKHASLFQVGFVKIEQPIRNRSRKIFQECAPTQLRKTPQMFSLPMYIHVYTYIYSGPSKADNLEPQFLAGCPLWVLLIKIPDEISCTYHFYWAKSLYSKLFACRGCGKLSITCFLLYTEKQLGNN